MIYVSPSGNDSWSGLQHEPNLDSTEGPVATLEKARNTIRELKRSGSLTQTEVAIFLREGIYVLSQSFYLAEQDSGTEQAPIVYRPFQNETVRITTNSHISAPLITVQNAEHVVFKNLILEHTPDQGIHINGGNNIHLQNCTIHHTDGSAIAVAGGNRQTLERSNHTISGNEIHHTKNSHAAIQVSGVGISITNNHIHQIGNPAIHLSGNEHHITKNHIHHISLNATDQGTIYMGGNWTERGIRIQHNFLHDLDTTGVHMDDCASGSVIQGNIFARCTKAILIGGGRNHRIENNIFSDCETAIEIDGRGLDGLAKWQHLIFHIMKPSFEAVNPLESPYSDRYPELREVAIYYQAEIGIPPEGNLIVRNICHNSQWFNIHWHAESKDIAIQNNITKEDPLFSDPTSDDYTLHEDSPVYELGFKPIPADQIGPIAEKD